MSYIYKLIFFSSLIFGTMISISSYSWFGAWMGLEINLLSFIPILNQKNNSYSSESSMKYFLIQAFASSIFLFSLIISMIMINSINLMNINKFISMITSSALMMKMGMAPFHFWFPEIIEGMNWMNSLILLSWQKIAPMMLISYIFNNKIISYFIFAIIMSSIIGGIGGLNQLSMRKLMAYSSINHMSWMLSSILISNMIWIIYFTIYTITSITLILLFNSSKIYYLKQMYMSMNKMFLIKFLIIMNLFSLGGLPPFLGFLPKWMIIQNLININFMMTLIMIFMTLITLFFYLRIMYSTMLMMNNEINFNMIYNLNYKNNILLMILTSINMTGMILFTISINP